MIREVTGDIFLSKADVIAHGVAPSDDAISGLGKSMKDEYPEMYAAFRDYCRALHPMPGDAWTWSGTSKRGPLKVVCLFTQQQALAPREKTGAATLESVETSLKNLKSALKKLKAKSVAIPRIGTGAGGLDWNNVKPVIEKTLGDLQIPVIVYSTYKPGTAAE